MKFYKKAMENHFLIMLLVGIATLIVILIFLYEAIETYKYNDGLISCNQFINGVNGKPSYFSSSLDKPSAKFKTSLSLLCPSKTVTVDEKNIGDAIELVKECYFKMGSGLDFLGTNVQDLNFCLYCGKIESNSEFNFKENFKKELKNNRYEQIFSSLFDKDKETTNINEITLNEWLPDTISKEKPIEVYYRIDRGKAKKTTTKIKIWISKKIGTSSNAGKLVTYLLGENNIETYAYIVLYNEGMDKKTKENSKDDCYYIIPNKNYE